jgi:hypothetical protein
MSTAENTCKKINELLTILPIFHKPSSVLFKNGLYFFYESGEISNHEPNGRIVRIGNHPRTQDGLKKRLNMHYQGSKNSSVFRKYLGGAIIRQKNPDSPCLMPNPGQGHWEKQNLHVCEECKPVEKIVSNLLKNNFSFRCVEFKNREMRNSFEEKLIATVSLCPICRPSEDWLGKYAYSDNVRKSGLWNSDYTFNYSKLLTNKNLDDFKEAVDRTLVVYS